MTKRRLFFIISSIFFVSFCQSWERQDFVRPLPPPRRAPQEIEVSYTLPQKNHSLISQITIRYNQGYNRDKILDKLKKIASQSGADGFVIDQFTSKNDELFLYGGKPGATIKNEQYEMRVLLYRYEP